VQSFSQQPNIQTCDQNMTFSIAKCYCLLAYHHGPNISILPAYTQMFDNS